MPKEPDYYTVIEEEDTCEHTFGVKLEIDFGNVERYNARGQKNNPAKKKPGRQPQRRSDRTFAADLDRFLDQVKNKINPWESDSDSHGSNSTTSEETDGNADALGIDDPLNRTGSQFSKGRAPATGPLHPGCTLGKGKKSDISPDDTANLNGPVKFSNLPGAKRGHPSSLLPGSSPLKKEADEKEKKVHAVRLAEEHKRKREEEEEEKREEKREKRRRKEEKKLEKLRQVCVKFAFMLWFTKDEKWCIILPIHVPSHWICAFVDFDHNYLAIFDSWKVKVVPDNDWKRCHHAKIFQLIKEWLQRLFLSLGSAIDWDEWQIDPCLERFRYILFGRMMQLEQKPIIAGENEECGDDSDVEMVSPPASEDGSYTEVL
ncbi:hypothetical protein B0H10DRAFT_1958029 [Mycena sp. CBHHK59/15]|nr:hypothetical protein B0H10DRAFT_1958029 [Mycena sp. CBHHK59/15]